MSGWRCILPSAVCIVLLGVAVSVARSQAGGDAGYVDAAACAGCHPQIAEDYSQTGMGRSFHSVRSNSNLREFDAVTFHHGASEQYFKPYKKDDRYYLRRHQIGLDGSIENVLESEVHYVFGSGNHARSYLHRTPAGTLVELPLTWYAENGGRWSMSPAYDRPDHRGFSREITYRCLFCHNGYPQIEPGADSWDGASIFPERMPEGIDCQRCHGPGRDHVSAARSQSSLQRVRTSILNPSRLSPERQTEICLQCHLETTSGQLPSVLMRRSRGVFSYQPSEPLADYMLHFDHAGGSGHDEKFELVSSAYRLQKSRCFLASAGWLTCTTCHNPHKAFRGEDAARRYDEACRGCHRAAQDNRHPAAKDCAGCHMPRRRPSDAIHIVITDHLITARPPAAPERGIAEHDEEHDGNTPPYSGKVTLYYPPSLPRTTENELDLAIAQVRQQSNIPAGLHQLEAAIAKYRPQRSEPYFEMAEAYRRVSQPEKAVPFYEQAAKRQPIRWYYFSALGTALASTGQPKRALESIERALKLAPREVTVLYALGDMYASLGRLREAESTFRRAVAVNPERAEGANNLGTTLLRLGDIAGAEAALREAVRLNPENPATHTNLAGVLSRKGDHAGAKYHFERALRIGPSLAQARSAMAAALARNATPKQARDQYDAAIRRQNSDANNNLGTALAALGDADRALYHYRLAVADAPDSGTANLNLAVTLAARGDLTEAERYLRIAAQSRDFQVRDAASKLLHNLLPP